MQNARKRLKTLSGFTIEFFVEICDNICMNKYLIKYQKYLSTQNETEEYIMFEVRSEAQCRVLSAVEDIKSCCEIGDYYEEWSDIAASSIQAFLEDLTAEQLDDTCGAFREYISETAEENSNLANGIKEALTICLNEMIDYIGDVPEDDDSEDKDYYSDYDRDTSRLVDEMKSALERIAEIKI